MTGQDVLDSLEEKNASALTHHEIDTLIFSSVAGSHPEGQTEEQIRAVVDWGNQARTEATLLKLALEERIAVYGVDKDDGTVEIMVKLWPENGTWSG